MVYGNCYNFLSINLVKLHNTTYIGEITTIRSLFSLKKETTKAPNLFQHHHMLVQDATMH